VTLTALQVCRSPGGWPTPPEVLSVTVLAEIEACPRRWALRNADYPSLWAERGYPPAPSVAALSGSAVHLALEEIAMELLRADCESAQSEAAVAVIRRMGGFTRVVEASVLKLVSKLEHNPRAATRTGSIRRTTLRDVPKLRERVQRLLSRLRLSRRPAGLPSVSASRGRRGPLPTGSYTELRLAAPSIGWRGTADLVSVSAIGCEIVDFKTGERSEQHVFQLQVYALLWRLDSELNPRTTLATSLVISYVEADVPVPPPSAADLDGLQRELLARTAAAREQLSIVPPPATPSADACGSCPVRHLCTEYWQPDTIQSVRSPSAEVDRYADLEIEVLEPEGPGMWSALVIAGTSVARGSTVKLQVTSDHLQLVEAGRRLRMLGATVMDLDDLDLESKPTLIRPSAWTEVFVNLDFARSG
jgi:CRISPR/Cas system-associated exonuclease Cas4 (RecB family)